MMRAYWLACALLMPVFAHPVTAVAQSLPRPPERVSFDIALIEATTRDAQVDRRLEPFLGALRQTPFTGFRLARQVHGALGEREPPEVIDLGEGRRLELLMIGRSVDRARLRLRYLFPGDAPVVMTLEIVYNRAFLTVLESASPDRALLLKIDVRS